MAERAQPGTRCKCPCNCGCTEPHWIVDADGLCPDCKRGNHEQPPQRYTKDTNG